MKTLLLILVLPFNLWGQETDKALDAKITLSGVRGSGVSSATAGQDSNCLLSSASAQSSSVQPAIAACPQGVKTPVDAGLLGKIIVPYDNSLFLRSDLPYFLGDSYIPRSSVERAQYQIVP